MSLNVYPANVDLIFPVATTGRRRQYHIPDQPPVSAEVLDGAMIDRNAVFDHHFFQFTQAQILGRYQRITLRSKCRL
ncbi:hypothetical protein NKH61_34600 [Mesorhizobium sp. M1005]|uniref:hypothetical protein n=1 Tax=unclassified Mesorhizobium TaxID=325217 RepID=UPI0033357EE4